MGVLDLFKLTGKTAIVTGGGRGLGAQIAQGFAEAGIANIVLCSRNMEACRAVGEELEHVFGISTLAVACDVTNPEDVKAVVEKTLDAFGTIDILVNNSGASWGAPVEQMPKEAWDKVIGINVTGTSEMCPSR